MHVLPTLQQELQSKRYKQLLLKNGILSQKAKVLKHGQNTAEQDILASCNLPCLVYCQVVHSQEDLCIPRMS